jgi:hypothetical protein
MVRNFTARRAGGSETAKRSQPGNREAVLRGLRGNPGVPPKKSQSKRKVPLKIENFLPNIKHAKQP